MNGLISYSVLIYAVYWPLELLTRQSGDSPRRNPTPLWPLIIR